MKLAVCEKCNTPLVCISDTGRIVAYCHLCNKCTEEEKDIKEKIHFGMCDKCEKEEKNVCCKM